VGQQVARHTTRRNRHRRIIAQGQPPCALCGGEINYNAESHLDPHSFTIDHVIPIDKGGADVIENLQAAHRSCNRMKSNTFGSKTRKRVAYITGRAW